jgi:hypothetical protein
MAVGGAPRTATPLDEVTLQTRHAGDADRPTLQRAGHRQAVTEVRADALFVIVDAVGWLPSSASSCTQVAGNGRWSSWLNGGKCLKRGLILPDITVRSARPAGREPSSYLCRGPPGIRTAAVGERVPRHLKSLIRPHGPLPLSASTVRTGPHHSPTAEHQVTRAAAAEDELASHVLLFGCSLNSSCRLKLETGHAPVLRAR